MQKTKINLIVLISTIIILLIILEIFLRIFFPISDNLFIGDKIIGHKHIPDKKAKYLSEEYKTISLFNSEGFRDINHEIENQNKTRIAFLGDSFTDALEVNFENSFHQILKKDLNKNYPNNYEIFNFGMWYFSTAQEYLLYKEYVKKYSPDIIYLQVFYNDPYETCLPNSQNPSYYLENNQIKAREFIPLKTGKLKLFISKYSKLAVLIRKTYKDFQAKTSQQELTQQEGIQKEKKVYLENYDKETLDCFYLSEYFLKKLKQEIENDNAELRVIIISHPASIYEKDKQEFLENTELDEEISFDKPEKQFENILNKLGIKYISTKQEFKNQRKRVYFEKDKHLNEKGHEILGKMLYENLINKKAF